MTSRSTGQRTTPAPRTPFGPHSHDALLAASNLVTTLARLDRHSEALELCQTTCEGLLALHGPHHGATLIVLEKLTSRFEDLDRYEETIPYYRALLKAKRRFKGDTDPDVLGRTFPLARLVDRYGKRGESREFFRRAVAGNRAVLGPTHEHTLISAIDYAWVLFDEESPIARREFERIVDDGKARKNRVYHSARLGAALRRSGTKRDRTEAADALHELALALGDDDPRVKRGRARFEKRMRQWNGDPAPA